MPMIDKANMFININIDIHTVKRKRKNMCYIRRKEIYRVKIVFNICSNIL